MISEEHKRLAIFTVKNVVRGTSPVLLVVHDNDNEWQFLPNESVTEEDIMIISLENIIKIDPTLEEILWIPEGTEAVREDTGKDWTTKIYLE